MLILHPCTKKIIREYMANLLKNVPKNAGLVALKWCFTSYGIHRLPGSSSSGSLSGLREGWGLGRWGGFPWVLMLPGINLEYMGIGYLLLQQKIWSLYTCIHPWFWKQRCKKRKQSIEEVLFDVRLVGGEILKELSFWFQRIVLILQKRYAEVASGLLFVAGRKSRGLGRWSLLGWV